MKNLSQAPGCLREGRRVLGVGGSCREPTGSKTCPFLAKSLPAQGLAAKSGQQQ